MSYLHPGLLSCRKPDGPFEYSGTNLTKTLGLIAVHTAIDGRSVHSLGYITTPFKYSGYPFIFLISRSGNRNTILNQILPLGCKVHQGCKVWLSRFAIQIIKILIGRSTLIIFICKSCKAVPQFVNKYDTCQWVICSQYREVVVHTSSTILICVDKQHNMIVSQLCCRIIDLPCRKTFKIALNTKGVEGRIKGSILPFSNGRNITSAFG